MWVERPESPAALLKHEPCINHSISGDKWCARIKPAPRDAGQREDRRRKGAFRSAAFACRTFGNCVDRSVAQGVFASGLSGACNLSGLPWQDPVAANERGPIWSL